VATLVQCLVNYISLDFLFLEETAGNVLQLPVYPDGYMTTRLAANLLESFVVTVMVKLVVNLMSPSTSIQRNIQEASLKSPVRNLGDKYSRFGTV